MPFRHRNIRLGASNYVGRRRYFLTLCCDERRPVFTEARRALWMRDSLEQEAVHHQFGVHAFCIMPDHVHFLAEGLGPASNLLALMKTLKLKTTFAYHKDHRQPLWQKKFYDHILRPRESADSVAWYIWLNPVRKGMCTKPHEYPFSGSFTLDWKSIVQPFEPWTPPWKNL